MDSDRTAERSYFAAVDSVYTFRYRRPWEGVRRFAMKISGQAMDHRARYGALYLIERCFGARMRIPAGAVRCPQTIDLKPGSVCLKKEGTNGK